MLSNIFPFIYMPILKMIIPFTQMLSDPCKMFINDCLWQNFFYPNLLIFFFFKLTSWLKPEFCIQATDLFINLPYKFFTNSLKETAKDQKITENEHLTPTDVYPQFKAKIHKTLWEICIYFCCALHRANRIQYYLCFITWIKKRKKKERELGAIQKNTINSKN